jgi:simple sugar transport system permease protein
MLVGAFTSVAVTQITENSVIGLLSAMLTGFLFGLITIVTVIALQIDQVVNGVGIWILGLGLSTFMFKVFTTGIPFPTVKTFEPISIPYLSQIPFLGPVIFQQNFLVYLSLLAVPILWFILFRTTMGLRVRAVGENPRAADSAGINVNRVRSICVLFSTTMAGLGGAYLTLAYVGLFTHNMVAGRGFIALAIVIFGKWSPLRALLGALIFGGVEALQINVQALSLGIPYQLLSMLPYVMTIVVLILIGRKAEFPSALGTPYKR